MVGKKRLAVILLLAVHFIHAASLLDMPDTRHVFEIRYMRHACVAKNAYAIFIRISKVARFFYINSVSVYVCVYIICIVINDRI